MKQHLGLSKLKVQFNCLSVYPDTDMAATTDDITHIDKETAEANSLSPESAHIPQSFHGWAHYQKATDKSITSKEK